MRPLRRQWPTDEVDRRDLQRIEASSFDVRMSDKGREGIYATATTSFVLTIYRRAAVRVNNNADLTYASNKNWSTKTRLIAHN